MKIGFKSDNITFFIIILVFHILFHLKTNNIPTPTDALLLLTLYLFMIKNGIEVKEEKMREKK